jgi:hypothetical protein
MIYTVSGRILTPLAVAYSIAEVVQSSRILDVGKVPTYDRNIVIIPLGRICAWDIDGRIDQVWALSV